MAGTLLTGNLEADGKDRRGWFVGHFVEEPAMRHSTALEIKWFRHPKDDVRPKWVTGETRTTLLVLISGRFAIDLGGGEIVLAEQGDYAMWGPEVDHRWRAIEESVMLTVRWPST